MRGLPNYKPPSMRGSPDERAAANETIAARMPPPPPRSYKVEGGYRRIPDVPKVLGAHARNWVGHVDAHAAIIVLLTEVASRIQAAQQSLEGGAATIAGVDCVPTPLTQCMPVGCGVPHM
eukprot:5302541-Amphidinium_carterae.1